MSSPVASTLSRDSTLGEEIANSISHGLGLLLAVAALPILIIAAWHSGSTTAVVASAVFGASAVLLYLASTLYHAIPHQRIKELLQRFDYAAIYLLIAGTYTPIALGVLRGSWGWSMLGVIWGLALLGVIFKLAVGARFHRLSTALYVAMGWAALIAIRPLWLHMAPGGLAWLLAGGLAYTLGVVFFLLHERVRYSHFIWHLFVLAGTGCHYFTVLRYTF
ncbi:hemolysin III family protein [Rhodanobacter sp. AS-Z3]|uniref:PAQR family membrane homeostasis protein TrhA n=1 Tax=Rhodanobacter sp. AS-Z3 TaxID=3031330 RepID=UPI00247AF365|nr:hemolysin III family protein [Rhodanobacter sp. AS-Z3]WEN14536.1 hemolysin III family protein [Rhodanobacter sp. AS-Z3]